jgi:crotonobetainyl-CoA:carnitine CoA-transferase CaiB-like acyl-CoA transferase
LSARARWTSIASPVGALDALLPPVTLEDLAPHMGAVPALGEHTSQILAELGVDAETVAGWRTRGIV